MYMYIVCFCFVIFLAVSGVDDSKYLTVCVFEFGGDDAWFGSDIILIIVIPPLQYCRRRVGVLAYLVMTWTPLPLSSLPRAPAVGTDIAVVAGCPCHFGFVPVTSVSRRKCANTGTGTDFEKTERALESPPLQEGRIVPRVPPPFLLVMPSS